MLALVWFCNRVFRKLTKLAIMAILASEALLHEKNPFYTNLTFACKTKTLGSLYSQTLLILLKSSKSKHQVVNEQKFKDLLSSTCQVSVERIVLDLESEVMRDPGSIPTGDNILSLDFFHVVKPLMPILPILSICEKLD